MAQVSEDWTDEQGLPAWPAAERNKGPIGNELVRILGELRGVLLEISAATGQHASAFVARLPNFDYWVSDCDETHLETLKRRVELSNEPRLRGPLRLDVTEARWPIESADVIYNANMLHIAPWGAAEGLFAGAGRLLTDEGVLLTYGPYRIDGKHTSESNASFDASLLSRDASWGVRDLEELRVLAEASGLTLVERVVMPANNFLLVWARR